LNNSTELHAEMSVRAALMAQNPTRARAQRLFLQTMRGMCGSSAGVTIIERFFDLNQAIMLLGLTYLVSAG